MSFVMKKAVPLLLIVFVLYFVFTNPAGAADMSKRIADASWTGLQHLFGAIIQFLNAIFS